MRNVSKGVLGVRGQMIKTNSLEPGTLEAEMSNSSELAVLDQLLDNGRKVHRYIDELALKQPGEAKKVKERLNYLCDRALAIYFYEDQKQTEFQSLLNEVKDLLEDGKRGQLAA